MPMGISSAATRWWLRPVGGNFRRQLGAPSAFIVVHENVLNAMVTPGAAIDLVHSASVTGEIEALNTLIDVVLSEMYTEDGTWAVPGTRRSLA